MGDVVVDRPTESTGSLVLRDDQRDVVLARFEAVARPGIQDAAPPSAALFAALHAIGVATPGFAEFVRSAVASGNTLKVTFPSQAMELWRAGNATLLPTSNGLQATLIDNAGRFVANGHVVGPGLPGIDPKVLIAGAALPILAATAAAYMQQRQLEKALASIQASVDRIEQRLKDTENGVCSAAESFVSLAAHAQQREGLPSYLRLELAQHRQAVVALHEARHRYVERFKRQLETAQIEREQAKGAPQPWVRMIGKANENDRLVEELSLYLRTLILTARLDVLAAAVLAEEGAPYAATELLSSTARQLRKRFYDLHNRLRPLARIAPEKKLWSRLPLVGDDALRAHASIQALVAEINDNILGSIPEPEPPDSVHLELSSGQASELVASLAVDGPAGRSPLDQAAEPEAWRSVPPNQASNGQPLR